MDDATHLSPGAASTPSRTSSESPDHRSRDRSSKDSRTTSSSGSSGWLSSSGAIDHGRFEPGTLLGGRYRIVERVGRGRHGRGVSRGRLEARTAGRAQVSAARRRPRSGPADAAPYRGPDGAAGVAPERLPRLRHRRDRRRDVPVHGIRRRRGRGVAAPARRPIPGRSRARDRAPDLRGPGRRARARCHPSRSEAGQRDARRDRQGPHHRLRPGRRVGRSASGGHARLHGAGATLGRRRHGPKRHLLARAGALRDLHRPARARRQEPRRADPQARAVRHPAADGDRQDARSEDRARRSCAA